MSQVLYIGKFLSEGGTSYCSGDTIIFIFVVLHFSTPYGVGTDSPRFLSRTPASEFLPYCGDWLSLESKREKCCKREGYVVLIDGGADPLVLGRPCSRPCPRIQLFWQALTNSENMVFWCYGRSFIGTRDNLMQQLFKKNRFVFKPGQAHFPFIKGCLSTCFPVNTST